MPSIFCIVRYLVSQLLDVAIFVVLQLNRSYQENQSFMTLKNRNSNCKYYDKIFGWYLKSLDLVTRSRSHSWAKISNKKNRKCELEKSSSKYDITYCLLYYVNFIPDGQSSL